MAKHTKVIQLIREKVRDQEYEFVIPHFFEEMANDDLAFDDTEFLKMIRAEPVMR